MPTLAPVSILEVSNLTGTVSGIQDDPSTPDASWLTAASDSSDTSVRTSFSTVTPSGSQTFRALVRKFGGTGTPTAYIELWQGGTLIRTGSATNVTGNTLLTFAWNSSELTATGSAECRVYGARATGSPTVRATVEVGAIAWDYTGASSSLSVVSSTQPSTSSVAMQQRSVVTSGSSTQPTISSITTQQINTFSLASNVDGSVSNIVVESDQESPAVVGIEALSESSYGQVVLESISVSNTSVTTDSTYSSIELQSSTELEVDAPWENVSCHIEIAQSSHYSVNAYTDNSFSSLYTELAAAASTAPTSDSSYSSIYLTPYSDVQANPQTQNSTSSIDHRSSAGFYLINDLEASSSAFTIDSMSSVGVEATTYCSSDIALKKITVVVIAGGRKMHSGHLSLAEKATKQERQVPVHGSGRNLST